MDVRLSKGERAGWSLVGFLLHKLRGKLRLSHSWADAGYASQQNLSADVSDGSIATYSTRVNGRLMSAVPRNRTQSQSIGICCDGAIKSGHLPSVSAIPTRTTVLLNF